MSTSLAFLRMPGGWEMVVVLVVALLLFGKRLPDVARGVGKSIVEFKKGLKGMTDEIDTVNREIDQEVDRAVAAQQLEAKPAPADLTTQHDRIHTA